MIDPAAPEISPQSRACGSRLERLQQALDVNGDASRVWVEAITTEHAFTQLRSSWEDLVGRMTHPSVFVRHDWFAAAWAWRRNGANMRMLVVRDHNAIVAILPLIAARDRGGRRMLTLLTIPDTQHCDLVVAADAVDVACHALAAEIASRRDWDILMLDYLAPDGSILRHLVPALGRHGVRTAIDERGVNPCIPLDGSWAAYWASRSRSLKKACNLATNRLQKAGVVRVEHAGPGSMTDAQFQAAIDAAIEISRRSWKHATGNSLDHSAPGDFIRCLSHAARHQGWLSVWIAYLDERPVAMEYQLACNGSVHALRADFDAQLEHLSPGSFLFRQLIEDAFDRGDSLYLMGPGDNAYKARWATDGQALCRAWGYNRTLHGRVAFGTDRRLKPLLRALRRRLREVRKRGHTPSTQ